MSTQRFTDLLREQNHTTWEQAVTHRFVQDYRCLDSFLMLLGASVSTADALEPRLRFTQFLDALRHWVLAKSSRKSRIRSRPPRLAR